MPAPGTYGVLQQTPRINLFAIARGQTITSAHKLERITNAAKEVLPTVVKNAVRPLGGRNGESLIFSTYMLDAAIRAADRAVGGLIGSAVPDIEVTQDPDDLVEFTLRDMFNQGNFIDMKPTGGMQLLAKLLYAPFSDAIIKCLPAAENERYARAMDTAILADKDCRLALDLRSYLHLYFKRGGMRDPQGEEMAKERSIQAFQTSKFDAGRDLTANLDYFEQTLLRAQMLTENSVSHSSAIYKLTEFIKGSGDHDLVQYYERVRFPQGMLGQVADVTYEKLLTQLRSYARANPTKRREPQQPKRPAANATGNDNDTGPGGGRGGRGGRGGGRNGRGGRGPGRGRGGDPPAPGAKAGDEKEDKALCFEICPKCFWRISQDEQHECVLKRCTFCNGKHLPGDCKSASDEMKATIIGLRHKNANSHNVRLINQADLGDIISNKTTLATAGIDDDLVTSTASFSPTDEKARLDHAVIDELSFLTLVDSGTNIDLICNRDLFAELTKLPKPLPIGSISGKSIYATHYGPVDCNIENDASGLRVNYYNTLAFYSREAPYNVINTPQCKAGGFGALVATERGTRICNVLENGEIEVLADLVTDLPNLPPQAEGMIFAYLTPASRPSMHLSINDMRAVAGNDMGEALTLAVRRAGSPGQKVTRLLLDDKERYNFMPSAGARPLDPVVALGMAKRQPSHPSRFNHLKTVNKDKSLYVDISGPHPPAPDFFNFYDGAEARYGVHITMLPSRTREVHYAPDMTGAVMANIIDGVLYTAGADVVIFGSDCGSNLIGKEVQAVLDKHGVRRMDSTVPGEKEGNAYAESNVRQTRGTAAKLAASSRILLAFAWPILFMVAPLKDNHLPHADTGISSYEAKYGRPWNFGNDHCVGALAYVYDENRPAKTDPPACQGIYIHNAQEIFHKRGHVVLFPETGEVAITHHVQVDETKYPELSQRTWLSRPYQPEDDFADAYIPPGPSRAEDIDPIAFVPLAYNPFADVGRGGTLSSTEAVDIGRGDGADVGGGNGADIGRGDEDHDAWSGPGTPIAISGPATPTTNIQTLDELLGIDHGNIFINAAKVQKPGIPLTIKQAMQSIHSAKWKAAIRKELRSLKDLGVFLELQHLKDIQQVAGVTSDTQIIFMDFTWAFKIKLDETYRARIALRGFKSGPLPLNETSSPTASAESFRIMTALSVAHLPDQFPEAMLRELAFDVDHAFMRATFDLSKRVYACKVPELYPLDDPNTCWLIPVKSLYGAKESSMRWYLFFVRVVVVKLKFTRSHADYCVFYKILESGGMFILIIHVDDGRITAFVTSQEEWDNFVTAFLDAFEGGIKILDGSMHAGVDIKRCENGVTISLETYLTAALKELDPDDTIPIQDTPYINVDMEKIIFFNDTSEILNFNEARVFLNRLGIANYVRDRARPDIEFACALISTKVSKPTRFALDAVNHVIGYLKNSPGLGITYSSGNLNMMGYSDASLNPLPGSRQYGGIFVSIGGGAAVWGARRQSIGTDNTADAESLAACALGRKIEGIIELIESIKVQVPLPVPTHHDNAASFLTMTTLTSRKTRHLALRIGVLRDQVMERFILKPKHILSADNLSDGMTKAYGPKDFHFYRDLWLNINQKKPFVPRVHPPHKK